MTPKLARVVVIALVVAAVAAAAVSHATDESTTGLDYVYSPDAKGIVEPLIARYNAEQKDVVVHGVQLTSGEAEAALAARTVRPALWTPASSLWGRLLQYETRQRWAAPSPSLVVSPQVIAIWESLARALGWPGPIGWKDVLQLATSAQGWAAYGHGSLGTFRLGHLNPDFSTSGLSAVVSEVYALAGKRRGLTVADVQRADVRRRVREIEAAIVHYGERAEAFTDNMDLYGEGYAHAVYIQETQLRKFNRSRGQGSRLVAIEPAEGTFVADYPVIALSAPWVTPEQRRDATRFSAWLRAHVTPEAAAREGFRTRRPTSIPLLEVPSGEVLFAVRREWRRERKPANVMLVVDSSYSMGGRGRLDAAKGALVSFLGRLSARDRVGLITSGDSAPRVEVQLTPASAGKRAVAEAVRTLSPNGERPVYPAVVRALAAVRALHDPNSINAVVVLSDGEQTAGGYDALVRSIRAHPVTEGTSVRIFTVAYGDAADGKALARVAAMSGGEDFAGGPKQLEGLYRKISSYF